MLQMLECAYMPMLMSTLMLMFMLVLVLVLVLVLIINCTLAAYVELLAHLQLSLM